MARRRVLAGPALAALAAVVLAACTPLAPVPAFDQSVRMSGGWSRLPDSPLSERHDALGVPVDGRFLVLGGMAGPPCPEDAACTVSQDPVLRDGATFDPHTGAWAPIAPAPAPVSGDNAVVLDGALYLLSGEEWRSDVPASVLRYDVSSDAWTRLPAPPGWLNDRLVAAGGRLLSISPSDEVYPMRDWIFLPESGEWGALPDDPLGPSIHREAVWTDGALLLTAKDLTAFPGTDHPPIVRLARLDLDTLEWTKLPDSAIIGWSPTVVGELVVFPLVGTTNGGRVNNWGRDLPLGGVLDPATGRWRSLPDPPQGGGLLGEVLAAGDRTVVGGHLLDPATGEWMLVPLLPHVGRTAATVAALDDTILVWGGATGSDNLADGYLLRIPS